MDTTYKNILPIVAVFSDIAGPILDRTFVQFYRKRAKNEQNIWKFGQKCTKFENILKKGNLRHVSMTHMKQLEYALHRHIIHTTKCKSWHKIACDTTLSTIWPSKPLCTYTKLSPSQPSCSFHTNTWLITTQFLTKLLKYTYINPHTETHPR